MLGQTLRLAAVGIVCGATAALAVSYLLSARLFGVFACDPRVYVTARRLSGFARYRFALPDPDIRSSER